MIKQNKVFYNVVIDGDLFFTIYDYLRFNPGCARDYKVFSTRDFDNLTLEDWKDLAEYAIWWLEYVQLPKVYVIHSEEWAPSLDTWGTLYYQTLNYMAIKNIRESIRKMTLNETVEHCIACIEYLKELAIEIHEPTDEDI